MWTESTMSTALTNQVYSKILSFVEIANCLVSEMKNRYACENLLASYRERRIEKSGTIDDSWEYCFHGRGCRFEYGDDLIDVEFGEDGRSDLFDPWRIFRYVSGKVGFESVELQEVEIAFSNLEKSGKIEKVNEEQFAVSVD